MSDLILHNRVEKLDAALVKLLLVFMQGRNYDTQNPYTRPEVKEALKTLKDVRGLDCDWADVLKAEAAAYADYTEECPHPEHPFEKWMKAVASRETEFGYSEWVLEQITLD